MAKKSYGNFGYIKSFHSFAAFMSEPEIRDRIKAVAHELVMKYSIRSVSMDDIASKLGMSKKTIYLYFKDKDELIQEIVEDVIAANQATCTADKASADNAIHEIFLAMEMMVKMFRTMNPSVLFDMQKYHDAAYQHFRKHKYDFIYNMMKHNILRGQEEGLYREDIRVEALAWFRVDSMMIPFNPDYLEKASCSLMEAEEEVITHWVFGLATAKGHKTILKYLRQKEKVKETIEAKNEK